MNKRWVGVVITVVGVVGKFGVGGVGMFGVGVGGVGMFGVGVGCVGMLGVGVGGVGIVVEVAMAGRFFFNSESSCKTCDNLFFKFFTSPGKVFDISFGFSTSEGSVAKKNQTRQLRNKLQDIKRAMCVPESTDKVLSVRFLLEDFSEKVLRMKH